MPTTETITPEQDQWSPCRRHLMDLLFAVTPGVRDKAFWRMPSWIWDRIIKDPELKSNWSERRNGTTSRRLFELPVFIVARGLDHVQLTIDLPCAPGRR